MGDKLATQDNDWVLKAMVAVAASDGGLEARETGLIQKVYQDQSGHALSADEVARAADALAKGDAIAEFAAAAKTLDRGAKEEVIKGAYRVLLQVPPGYGLAPGDSAARSVSVARGQRATANWQLLGPVGGS